MIFMSHDIHHRIRIYGRPEYTGYFHVIPLFHS